MTSNELCLPTTSNFNKNNNNSSIPKHISLLFSFIFSHPLYLSYFIFFSPYLFKFISFISPLFFTTTLLLLCIVLATTFPQQPKLLGFFIIQTIVDKLRSKMNDVVIEEGDREVEFPEFEDLEIYKIVFHDHPPLIDISTSIDEDKNDDQLKQVTVIENTVRVMEKSEEERSLEKLFEELDRFEDSRETIEMKANKTIPQRETNVGESITKLEPVGMNKLEASCEDKKILELKSNSWRTDSSSSLFGSYGSMRKEKEWKRTLACKLFEERNNSGGEEGMDSLWESYEEDNASRKSRNRKEATIDKKKATTKNNKKKKSEFKYFYEGDDDVEEDDDEEEFMSNANGQLCCLKALKLSTGKMNLGMGKPNLVKISKALKGFGWLHHVGSKHAKKV